MLSEIVSDVYAPRAVAQAVVGTSVEVLGIVFNAALVIYADCVVAEKRQTRSHFQAGVEAVDGKEVFRVGFEIFLIADVVVKHQLSVLLAECNVGVGFLCSRQTVAEIRT